MRARAVAGKNGRHPLSSHAPLGETPFGRVLEFMRLVWAFDHALQSRSKWMEARLGVTGPQRLVIRMIGCFPAISAGALADLLHVHPSTLTGVLRRLTDRTAIRRGVDPRDRRRALFWLTPYGRRIDHLRSGTVEAAITRALDHGSSRNVAAARRMLSRLSVELLREIEDEADAPVSAKGKRGRGTAPRARPSATGAGAPASSGRAARS